MTYRNAFLSAVLAFSAAAAIPAEAQTADQNRVAVRTADLNLGSADGQRALDARLAQAARTVCGIASDADLVGQRLARECRQDAVARARQDVAALTDDEVLVAAR